MRQHNVFQMLKMKNNFNFQCNYKVGKEIIIINTFKFRRCYYNYVLQRLTILEICIKPEIQKLYLE